MNCKNCQTKLEGEKKFCTNCGAKVINYRLNFKTVAQEFFATFISWDNKFFKTFLHLFTKPQEVANGYLNGIRKRYMQPFAYMILALTLYSIYMYFAKDKMMEYVNQIDFTTYQNSNSNPKKDMFMDNFMGNWMEFITKYFNIFTFLTIPFLALINKIIFKKRNFIEHNVTLYYSYATYLMASTILGFLTLVFNISYSITNTIFMILMIGYHMYFFKKMFDLDFWETILKTLFFWLIMVAFYFVFFIIGIIIVFLLLKLKIITM